MSVNIEPDTIFIGKKIAIIFVGIIFSLNAITLVWFFPIFKINGNFLLTNFINKIFTKLLRQEIKNLVKGS